MTSIDLQTQVETDEKVHREATRAYRHLTAAIDLLDQTRHDPFLVGRLFAAMNILERIVTDDGEGGLDIVVALEATAGCADPPG